MIYVSFTDTTTYENYSRGSNMSDHLNWDLWNQPSASFIDLIWKDHKCKILFIIWLF